MENRPYKSLSRLELKLRKELETVLVQEEIFWFQKSRRDWIAFGDRNTKFFHQKTITRRARNQIKAIKDSCRVWLYDPQEIKREAVEFFSDLYAPDQVLHHLYPLRDRFLEIEETMLASLGVPVDNEEIRNTIFQMSPCKALGIDGLPACFYQTQWSIVGDSLCETIKSIFNDGVVPETVNKTLLVLIPKNDHPSSFKFYRPISLCTVTYKTITKLIVNRLQHLLPDLIGPHQTSFVPGRHITENIIVAQEIIHSMKHKKGQKGWMAIKVDLEKAYDRLN